LGLGTPVVEAAWTPWSITLLDGLAAMIVGLVLAVVPLDTKGRLVALALLVVGSVAAGVGGWGHYHLDEQHLLTVPASIDPMPVVASYLGLALAGAMFLALGLLVSSLV